MILSIVVILFVGIIAYYHFVQGFFSATLSAFAVILSAVMAVGYDETLVHAMMRGNLADGAHSICLVLLFVVSYIVLRLIFDRLVPGNVRVPATINYIGAALMGLVAGGFTMGVFAIAVQMLPFDASVSFLGVPRYAMYPGHDVNLPAPGNGQQPDTKVRDQMKSDVYDSSKEEPGLFVPVDSIVLNTASWVSSGALSTGRPLDSVHPDWLGELFAQRASIQTGTRHVALVTPAAPNVVQVDGVYRVASLPAVSMYKGFGKQVQASMTVYPEGYKPDAVKPLTASRDQAILIVRIKMTSKVTDDEDKIVRFGPGSVRLVTRQNPGVDDEDAPGVNYFPVGTLQNGKTLVANRADDFLFANLGNGDAGFDAVFVVPAAVVRGSPGKLTLAPGTFVDFKRMAVLDLSGVSVSDENPPADEKFNPMRADVLKKELPDYVDPDKQR